jgi:hypothetical protein
LEDTRELDPKRWRRKAYRTILRKLPLMLL